MNQSLNSVATQPGLEDSDSRLSRRILYVMAGTVLLALVVSLPFVTWRVSTGLLLGGVLSLMNFHWMRSSIAATFSITIEGKRPKIRVAQYVLRYLVIGALIYVCYQLNLISLPAAFVGLSSFVTALFIEAIRESYLIIIGREGTN